jgi:glycosyltransferase involved in cell wall biosynthesis
VLIANDEATVRRARELLGRRAGRATVVAPGSYVGVYPRGRSRSEVRAILGIAPETRVFLCFGHLRRFKEVELLLDAFASFERPETSLLVVGQFARRVMDADWERSLLERLDAAQAADPRVRAAVRFVPEEEVAELFEAADVAVVPRGDGWTSGSLLLGLSQGLPVIAARQPAYAELVGESAGWLFEPHDATSLREALATAASASRAELEKRGGAARAVAESLRWEETARQTAAVLGATRSRS